MLWPAGTNHFGHFALTRDILPSMKALVRDKTCAQYQNLCFHDAQVLQCSLCNK